MEMLEKLWHARATSEWTAGETNAPASNKITTQLEKTTRAIGAKP